MRACFLSMLGFFVGLSGCSSKADPVPVAPVVDAGNVDAAPCEADSHRPDGGGNCDSVLSWNDGPAIAPARAQHTTFIGEASGKAFLYVVGGTDYTKDYLDAWMAPIGADGNVGAWTQTAPLPTQRTGHAVIVNGITVVLMGGKLGAAILNKVHFTYVEADGTFKSWLEGPPLTGPRFGHSAVVGKGAIYVTGGIEGTTAVSKVLRAPLGAGGLGTWSEAGDMPTPRTHHSSFVNGDYLYVVGGYDGDPAANAMPLKDISRAQIKDNGTLGAWTSVGGVDTALSTQANIVHNGFLYLLGGAENGNTMVDHVRRATIAADGTIGAFENTSPGLPKARGYVSTIPLYKSRLYVVGGTTDQKSVFGDVSVGTFQ